jgi:nitrate/nitrite transport system permease protein
MNAASLNLRAGLVSLLIFICFVGAWQLATKGPSIGGASTGMTAEQIEYAKMMGKDPGAAKSSGFPPPIEVGKAIWVQLSDPFYDNGPNDKGIGIQLAHSLGRVGLGFLLAVLVAIPAGFSDRHVAADAQGVRPVHPGVEAHQPARLDAAGAVHASRTRT